MSNSLPVPPRATKVALPMLVGFALLAGCATGPASDGINDPLEPLNRGVHAVNKGLDRVALRPASQVYGTVVPEPLRKGVSNVAGLLEMPSVVANQLLQGRVEDATNSSLRLAVNATAGIGGLFDVATVLGMPDTEADFGQTLAVWGTGEGAYVELPFFGPSNARDAVGRVVDIALDPLNNVFDGKDADAALGVNVLDKLNDRYTYSNTVDGLLYESADSYAQLRLLYLQNRRFELGKGNSATDSGVEPGDDFIDPYED